MGLGRSVGFGFAGVRRVLLLIVMGRHVRRLAVAHGRRLPWRRLLWLLGLSGRDLLHERREHARIDRVQKKEGLGDGVAGLGSLFQESVCFGGSRRAETFYLADDVEEFRCRQR